MTKDKDKAKSGKEMRKLIDLETYFARSYQQPLKTTQQIKEYAP